jgi:hypothetical protein
MLCRLSEWHPICDLWYWWQDAFRVSPISSLLPTQLINAEVEYKGFGSELGLTTGLGMGPLDAEYQNEEGLDLALGEHKGIW